MCKFVRCYTSSFFVGLLGERLLFILEHELRARRNPVIVVHNWQIAPPVGWPKQVRQLVARDWSQPVFARSCRRVVAQILRELPVGRVDEKRATQAAV